MTPCTITWGFVCAKSGMRFLSLWRSSGVVLTQIRQNVGAKLADFWRLILRQSINGVGNWQRGSKEEKLELKLTMVLNSLMLRHVTTYFFMSSGVSKWESKQTSAARSMEQANKWCERVAQYLSLNSWLFWALAELKWKSLTRIKEKRKKES